MLLLFVVYFGMFFFVSRNTYDFFSHNATVLFFQVRGIGDDDSSFSHKIDNLDGILMLQIILSLLELNSTIFSSLHFFWGYSIFRGFFWSSNFELINFLEFLSLRFWALCHLKYK